MLFGIVNSFKAKHLVFSVALGPKGADKVAMWCALGMVVPYALLFKYLNVNYQVPYLLNSISPFLMRDFFFCQCPP